MAIFVLKPLRRQILTSKDDPLAGRLKVLNIDEPFCVRRGSYGEYEEEHSIKLDVVGQNF